MKKGLQIAILIGFISVGLLTTSFAASEHKTMMNQQGMGMSQMPCVSDSMPDSMPQMMDDSMGHMMGQGMGHMMGQGMGHMMGQGMGHMMGQGMGHMMGAGMKHMLYLDQVTELNLSDDQVARLKAIHSACFKDSIRLAADIKIARFELSELLDGQSWTLKDAEPLVRKINKLQGDLQVRHFQGMSDARKVLTADQLKQALSGDSNDHLESLFQ